MIKATTGPIIVFSKAKIQTHLVRIVIVQKV